MSSGELRRFVSVAGVLVEHMVAGAAVVIVCVSGAVCAYASLLLWAVVTGSGLGGPLALPGIVLFVFIASAGAVLFILFPVTAATQFLCRRIRHRWIGEIVVSSLLTTVCVVALATGFAIANNISANGAVKLAAGASLILLVLLGLYWWTLQASDLLLRVAADVAVRTRRVWRARRHA